MFAWVGSVQYDLDRLDICFLGWDLHDLDLILKCLPGCDLYDLDLANTYVCPGGICMIYAHHLHIGKKGSR